MIRTKDQQEGYHHHDNYASQVSTHQWTELKTTTPLIDWEVIMDDLIGMQSEQAIIPQVISGTQKLPTFDMEIIMTKGGSTFDHLTTSTSTDTLSESYSSGSRTDSPRENSLDTSTYSEPEASCMGSSSDNSSNGALIVNSKRAKRPLNSATTNSDYNLGASKSMRVHVNRIVRLPRTDVKRSYIPMYANSVNSSSAISMEGFLATYCVPNVRYIAKVSSHEGLGLPVKLERVGIGQMTKFLVANFFMMPDMVLSGGDVCVYPRTRGKEIRSVASSSSSSSFSSSPSSSLFTSPSPPSSSSTEDDDGTVRSSPGTKTARAQARDERGDVDGEGNRKTGTGRGSIEYKQGKGGNVGKDKRAGRPTRKRFSRSERTEGGCILSSFLTVTGTKICDLPEAKYLPNSTSSTPAPVPAVSLPSESIPCYQQTMPPAQSLQSAGLGRPGTLSKVPTTAVPTTCLPNDTVPADTTTRAEKQAHLKAYALDLQQTAVMKPKVDYYKAHGRFQLHVREDGFIELITYESMGEI